MDKYKTEVLLADAHAERSSPDICTAESAALTSSLNELLRRQLNQNMPVRPEPKPDTEQAGLSECLVMAVEEILSPNALDRSALDLKLESLFDQLYELYVNADIDPVARKRQFIGKNGLVMSPDHCVTTQKDSLRVRAYMRAVNRAIVNSVHQNDGPLRIAYPACGPFAPLLLPLIAYYQESGLYDENDLRITLIDMQQGAVASLQMLVQKMKISGFIDEILCLDACDYHPSKPFNIVVLEAMQHGFSREGHLAIARHFAGLMQPDGIYIPQQISLSAVINTGQHEYVEQWQNRKTVVCEENMLEDVISKRVELGEILRLTPATLRDLPEHKLDEHFTLIECGEVLIPALEDRKEEPLLLICTRIHPDEHELIGEYDSGITHPLADLQVFINFKPHESKPGDLVVQSGDKLKFYYRLNGLPGFLATLANGNANNG